MRISELAVVTGVPVATMKYYVREGLLPPGRAITPRLSEYDEEHVRRLRLLRALREVGGVPVTRLRALVGALEVGQSPMSLLEQTANALAPVAPTPGPGRADAREMVGQVLDEAGWRVRPDGPDRENLAAALEVLAEFTGGPVPGQAIAPYVRAADDLARHEIGHLDPGRGDAALLQQMVVGQVLFGQVLGALRRLAEEHHSGERFGHPVGGSQGDAG